MDEPRWVQVARAVLEDQSAKADHYAICFAALEHYQHGQHRDAQLARAEGQLETVSFERHQADGRIDQLLGIVSSLAVSVREAGR